ncbi:alpha/beta fold hydrolase, partial [Streptomyces sp. E11-3]|uniref:alpha/beta fold hydrolase n=1 Tax=Streptomyces sp. E11-3 TaxID=3110112 RepID=UPI00398108FF
VARDLDLIRATLGEEKISLLGYSDGTYQCAVYGSMFGERVDRHVLDSSVDPRALWRGQYMTQAVAIRRNVDAWAGWVGEHHSVYGLGADPVAVLASVEEIGERLAAAPLGGVDRTVLDGLVGVGATHRPLWGELATTVVALGAGEYAAVEAAWLLAAPEWEQPAPGVTEVSGLVEATTSEGEWPSDLEVYYRDMRHYRRHYFYGYGVLRAQPWVAAFRSQPPREALTEVARNGYEPGLVVHAQGNPTLSYNGAVDMAARLGDRLVTVADDGSNEVFAVRGHQEVDRTVVDYLVDGTLPESNLILPSTPRPAPTA